MMIHLIHISQKSLWNVNLQVLDESTTPLCPSRLPLGQTNPPASQPYGSGSLVTIWQLQLHLMVLGVSSFKKTPYEAPVNVHLMCHTQTGESHFCLDKVVCDYSTKLIL